ncbi:MAG: hypothetical protein WBC92_15510 [Terracidiphilus sp.]
MRIIHKRLVFIACLLVSVPLARSQMPGRPETSVIDLAQKQIKTYLSKLADVHCTETVVQEKLAENGHVEASAKEQFDYLIMMSGHEDDFQMSESRIETPGWRHKLLSTPMLLTNGMATALLVFDPYYRSSFNFQALPEEQIDGRPAIPIHFAHIAGRRTPAALALRGREYPLELEGTAWLDKNSGEIVKVDATLLHDMSDIGLHSLKIHVEYKPMKLGTDASQIMMPALAVVDVTSARQHWRNTHFFGNYRSFSADVEQDPHVTIHPDNADPEGTPRPAMPPSNPKENP